MTPGQQDLDDLLRGASGFQILDGGPGAARPDSERLVLSCDAPEDVLALREVLRVVNAGGRCMCGGDATLCIVGRDGQRTTIGLHHGTSIRWGGRWDADARLVAPHDFAEFLAMRGWPRYRDALEDAQRRASDDGHARERWVAAMPSALRSMREDLIDLPGGAISAAQRDRARTLLVGGLGSEEAAVRELLGWYGSGAGRWSGFPSYESVARELLMTFPLPVLLGALQTALDEAALRGAVRHCAGWHFRKLRKKLPSGVVEKLRAHVEVGGDGGQRDAFRTAFGGQPDEIHR